MPFKGIIRDGKIDLVSPVLAMKFGEWKREHEGAHIIIDEIKAQRTLSQNAYYWVYLNIIEQETGELADDLHEYFKRKLLPPVFKTIRGEQIKLPRSTTDLDKLAFGEFLDKIAALTGVPLPNPEDARYISNYER